MTDKITIERETLERWTETLNQHVHHGKSEWWIALNEMRAALDAQPAKPVASYGEIESACRHAFEIEDGYGDPDSNPQRYRIFRDGFFAARVSAPPAPAAQQPTAALVPLTDAQIVAIADACDSDVCDQSQTTAFARAIERAHGIGDKT